MNIIFFGNTEFGIPTLDKLKINGINILLTVTNEDIRKNRNKIIETPIKKWSEQNNINFIQQNNINKLEFIETLKSLNADLFIVIAYKILPKEIFSLPKHGTMNLHGSLLPSYRGAAPIQRAILNGDTKTGVSTFMIDRKVDTGHIIDQEEININGNNYGELHDRLSFIGSDLIIRSINHILNKKPLSIQNSPHTYAPKINKKETEIVWNQNPIIIINLIRAFSPLPGAYTYFKDKRIRIFSAVLVNSKQPKLDPGIISVENKEIFVGTATKSIKIKELQVEGKQCMDDKSFINGYMQIKGNEYKFEGR